MSAWMLYCVAVAALVGGAASAAERALRSGGDRESRREARWIWATTLGVALLAGALSLTHTPARRAAPAIAPAATHDGRTPARGSAVAAGAAGAAFAGGPAARATTTSSIGRFPSLPSLRAPLVALWVTASALVTLWLAASALRLRHARRGWHRATVDDVAVLVSRDVGPAVVGAFGSEIVLPRWVLELDPARRALIIAHEREHVRARDPLLLAAAHAAVALAPWNPALWWIAAGLRRAVELDCDARVLRTHPDVGGYGALLLDVGRRAARGVVGWHHVPAAAFLHSTSTLERRIRIMTQSRTPRIHALRSLLLAGAALAAAALTPRPPALLAQSATAGSRDSSRASSARGDSGSRSASSARGGTPPRIVRVLPAGGGEGRGGATASSPPTVIRVDTRGVVGRGVGGGVGGGVGRGASGGVASDSIRIRFTERDTDERLAKGYLSCAAQQSRTGVATIELIVADEAAERPGRVTVLLDHSEGSEISVRFGRGTAEQVGCGGSETPWLRLSAERVQQDTHTLHITTPVALRLVARTPGGRTLADLDIGTRTRADSMTFEW